MGAESGERLLTSQVRGVGGGEEWGGFQWGAFLLVCLSSLLLVPGLVTHFGPSVILSCITLLSLAKLQKIPPNKQATQKLDIKHI